MPNPWHKPQDIVTKLRRAEVLVDQVTAHMATIREDELPSLPGHRRT